MPDPLLVVEDNNPPQQESEHVDLLDFTSLVRGRTTQEKIKWRKQQ
jgi:hypothetical protein